MVLGIAQIWNSTLEDSSGSPDQASPVDLELGTAQLQLDNFIFAINYNDENIVTDIFIFISIIL